LLIAFILDIFPRARKKLKISPADTDSMVKPIVIREPDKSLGTQLIILFMVCEKSKSASPPVRQPDRLFYRRSDCLLHGY
jgi:hypothetical protein